MASFGSLFFGGIGLVPYLIQFPVILTVILIAPRVIHDYGVKLIAQDYAINTASILDLRPETYDFILVGAGSAGAVVANRLSSPPNNFSVLVLEAGGDQNFVTRPPMFDFFVANSSMIDWKYHSVPQKKSCFSCVNQSFTCPRGKALGGCSTVNFMIYIRGNQKGFDNWARETGDDQWNSTNVLKYFKRSENYIGTFPDDDYHGCGGELFVDRIYYDTPSRDVLVKSLIKNENFTLKDLNKNQTQGFMELDTTINRGLRASTYEAFIKPILDRPNLRIYRYSNVTQLLFDPIDRTKVIGVKYFRHNVTEPKYAYAKREVIVSAGAINSATLLMQSGIGPRADLESLNIPVVKDLPVGKNLYDHPTVLFPILFEKPRTSLIFERDVMIDMVLDYDPPARVGPMGAPNVFATGYYSTPLNDDVHHPDMQHTLTYCGLTQFLPEIFVPFTNYPREVLQEYFRGYLGRDGNIVITTLVRPKSVGSVTLNRTSIYGMPLIDLNYFSDPEDYDLEAMISGMINLIDFYEKSPAYAEIGARFFPKPLPACRHHRFRSKDYFRCHVQHFTMSLFHFSGTCKMGKLGDPAAVTDSKLRVQGIKNLRVVDASVMPIVTNGNTNAPTIMIGELGSDIILRDHGGVTIYAGSQKPCPYISTTFP